jgi:hypothetical protein
MSFIFCPGHISDNFCPFVQRLVVFFGEFDWMFSLVLPLFARQLFHFTSLFKEQKKDTIRVSVR